MGTLTEESTDMNVLYVYMTTRRHHTVEEGF